MAVRVLDKLRIGLATRLGATGGGIRLAEGARLRPEIGPNDEIRSILLFRRGNARDGAGKRPEALYDYGEVLRIDADDVLSDWATELRQAPWPEAAPEGSHPAWPGSRGGA